MSDPLDTKADITYVNAELAKKADKTYVDVGLARKANSSDMLVVLATKANITDPVNIDKKADKTYVDAELGKKTTKAYVDAGLAKKADITAVAIALSVKANSVDLDATNTVVTNKADKTYVNNELVKKADKTYVDTKLAALGDVGDINKALAEKANVVDLTRTNITVAKKADTVYVDTELAKKTSKIYVDTELSKKVAKTYVDTELEKKVSQIYVDAALIQKADIIAMNAALGEKANTTDLTETNVAVSLKVDKTYVDTRLDTKADKLYIDTKLDQKADVVALEEKANVSDLTVTNNNLAKKADRTYVDIEVEKKVDTSEMLAKLAGKVSITSLGIASGVATLDENAKIPLTQLHIGEANGIASLDSDGLIPNINLPPLAITDTHAVNTQEEMLELTAQKGDVAVRTDLSKSFILTKEPATELSNWQELLSPPGGVVSVFGRPGVVRAEKGDYTADMVGAMSITHSANNITGLGESGTSNDVARKDHNHLGIYEPAIVPKTAFNKNFGTEADMVCEGNDPRLSNDRKPITHNHKQNESHDSADTDELVTSLHHTIGKSATQAAAGDHEHGEIYEPVIEHKTAFNKDFGKEAGMVCEGNDSRLTDDRKPLLHNHKQNESHESVDTDILVTSLHHTIGTGATQAAAGDHEHSGKYEPSNENIQTHIASEENPHKTTALQVKAMSITHPANDIAGLGNSGESKKVARDDHGHIGTYEPVIERKTAFNKDFGKEADMICEGNDSRLSDERKPLLHSHKQNESHESADTDMLVTSLHHTIGTNATQAAAGDHAHGDYVAISSIGQNNGIAGLDEYGLVPSKNLPPSKIAETYVIDSQDAMLLLDAHKGDIAIRNDESKTFILSAEPASDLLNWKELSTPTGSNIVSVFGRIGAVRAEKDDYTADMVGAMPITHPANAIKGFGSAGISDNVAREDHNHLGVYEPAIVPKSAFNKNFGTEADMVCEGNDPRLSNDRKPVAHTHIQNDSHNSADTDISVNALHHTIGKSATQAAAGDHEHGEIYEPVIEHKTAFNKDFGKEAGMVCEGNDSRLNDDRKPLSHNHKQNESHESVDTDILVTSLHHTIGTSATQAAAGDHEHSDKYEPSNENIQTHIASEENPHKTTALQVKAMSITHPANDIAGLGNSGESKKVARDDHGHAEIYEPIIERKTAFNKDFAGNGIAETISRSDHAHDKYELTNTELQNHLTNKTNPHSVDAEQVGAIASKEKGAKSGVCDLDEFQKVPLGRLPDSILGSLNYQGTWDALTNNPTLPVAGSDNKGWFYKTTVEGTQNSILFHVGDWVISNGNAWEKADQNDQVITVFGRVGIVKAQDNDYDAIQIKNTPKGNIVAENLQDAIDELDTEKEPVIGDKGTAFNKNFDGNGLANTVARSDHEHDEKYEPIIVRKTAFNKAFGKEEDTVCEGNDLRLGDSRNPLSHAVDADTYGYGDAQNAGHLRIGAGLLVAEGTVSVAYGNISGTSATGDHDHEGIYEHANYKIVEHIDSKENPHATTASQVKAMPFDHPASVINGFSGTGTESTVARSDHNHDSQYEYADIGIQNHLVDKNNPHVVTAKQINAEPADENIQLHIKTEGNPHKTIAEEIGAISSTEKGVADGVCDLDGDGKISLDRIPDSIKINIDTYVVNSEESMLVLVAQKGDVAVRTDLSKSFILTKEPATELSNWQELLTPPGGVVSVFGRQDIVQAQKDDYTADMVGAMPITHPANKITGFGNIGNSDNVAREDHTHTLEELSAQPIITANDVSFHDVVTTTNIEQEVLSGMTITPDTDGIYLIHFGSDYSNSITDSLATFSIFVNERQIASSIRTLQNGINQRQCIQTFARASARANQKIEGRWSVVSGTGKSYNRSLSIVRIGDGK